MNIIDRSYYGALLNNKLQQIQTKLKNTFAIMIKLRCRCLRSIRTMVPNERWAPLHRAPPMGLRCCATGGMRLSLHRLHAPSSAAHLHMAPPPPAAAVVVVCWV
jgi:hypothetical protein